MKLGSDIPEIAVSEPKMRINGQCLLSEYDTLV